MSLTFDFSGRTIIVTGAAQGIGLELTRLFAGAGAHVVAADLRAEEGVSPSSRVRPVQTNVAEPADAQRAIDVALDWTGRLDVVVNNAGVTRDSVVWKLGDDDWNAVIAVHLTGTFNMTRAAIAPMRGAGRGRIINVTSYTGLRGNFGQANYAAAKAGIIGFTKTVAKEVARFGITVNAISPNAETAMTAAIPDDARAELTRQIPIGRFASPAEISPTVGFLASDEAGYITGVVLPVDGGLSI